MGCIYLFELIFLFSLGKYPEVELLDHMVVLFLIFLGTSILFSIVVTPVYIPINGVLGFPFLYILTNTYFLSSFLFNIYLFIWLCWVLVAAHRIFIASCEIFIVACGIF